MSVDKFATDNGIDAAEICDRLRRRDEVSFVQGFRKKKAFAWRFRIPWRFRMQIYNKVPQKTEVEQVVMESENEPLHAEANTHTEVDGPSPATSNGSPCTPSSSFKETPSPPDSIDRALQLYPPDRPEEYRLYWAQQGQRDASHRWWDTLSEWLQEIGFHRSENDKCAFYHSDPDALIDMHQNKGSAISAMLYTLKKKKVQQQSSDKGLRVACHVDDLLTRGHIKHTRVFWELVKNRFSLKSWDVVDYDNPLIYTGIRIRKQRYGNRVWYSMDQAADIRDFLEQYDMWSAVPVTAPMPYKDKIYSDLTPLS